MEFLTILLGFLLFTFTLLNLAKKPKTRISNSKPPPGPWKLPVIGNLHQLAFSDLPHHRLRALAKKYGPLMVLKLGEVQAYIVTSPEVAKQVLKTNDVVFASRPYSEPAEIISWKNSGVVFAPYDNSWKQLHKICTSLLLTPKRVKSFRSIREEEVSGLHDWISSKGGSVINLSKKIFTLMCGITSRAAFGNKTGDTEAFVSIIQESTQMISGFTIEELFPSSSLLRWLTGMRPKLERLHKESDRIVGNIIDEHKRRKAASKVCKADDGEEDLVDFLLRIQEQGDLDSLLTDDQIRAITFDMLSSGSETAATTTDWTMCELMRNPKVMKKAQAEVREVVNRRGKVDEEATNEMTYLKLICKETLRLHPPAPLLLPRECGETCEISGFEIPEKAKVIVNAWAIGRDPELWTEPESFNPERFIADDSVDYKAGNFKFIPFGAGRRICPGIPFALALMELPLAMFLYHFDWQLPNGMKPEDMDMTESFGLTVKRKKNLCIVPTPYHPSPVASA